MEEKVLKGRKTENPPQSRKEGRETASWEREEDRFQRALLDLRMTALLEEKAKDCLSDQELDEVFSKGIDSIEKNPHLRQCDRCTLRGLERESLREAWKSWGKVNNELAGHPSEAEWFDWVCGDLPESGKKRLDEHLKKCTACRKAVEKMKREEEEWEKALEADPDQVLFRSLGEGRTFEILEEWVKNRREE